MNVRISIAMLAAYALGCSSAAPPSTSATPAATQGMTTATPVRLTIRAVDLRNRKGQLIFGVFRTSDGFPSDGKKSLNWQVKPAAAGDPADLNAVVFTCELPPGVYGASVLHDENANGQMDTRLGIPREGYGVTNNPKPRFRAAKFSESTFTLPPEGATLTISLQYF
jgi:uncharacterized protein (DUF2141 family)